MSTKNQLRNILGPSVVNRAGESVDLCQYNANGKVIGLYFSAHWCSPCRAFTPVLVDFYNELKKSESGADLEIVFVSSDRDQSSFDEYFAEMPWLAVPFQERDRKAKLSKKFRVQGIPSLVLLDGISGKVIQAEARECLANDPQGKKFPWLPRPFRDVIGDTLIDNSGQQVATQSLSDKIKFIYFSAHWCPACKAFTPQLVELYKKLRGEGRKLECVFVSSDRSEDSCLAILLSQCRIPSLVVLDEEDQLVTKEGRAYVNEDPEGEDFPWFPTPLTELTGAAASKLNEDPCLILFTLGREEDEVMATDLLADVAEDHFQKGAQQSLFFYYALDDEFCDTVRQFARVTDTQLPQLLIVDIPEQTLYRHAAAAAAAVATPTPLTTAAVREFVEKYFAGMLAGEALLQ
ncbi:PREDICTED: LOW QUALITY PROTEIN: nucleoredoxin-like [Priapulus caudatus]|uniref:Nucleoredoxin n=1 Tax=Priapulus caudatus TaxID=37621 RepID=A0ABM1ENE7_PRICU|nr:PREDICTED: LOW QUALITY PROTEIN: nucleoredoxin-like [Priapulus caudatus]